MVKRFFRKKYFIPQCQTVSISYLLDSFSDSSVFDFTKQIVSKVQTNNGNCNGVANCLVLPPTPHKRASRPAPDL